MGQLPAGARAITTDGPFARASPCRRCTNGQPTSEYDNWVIEILPFIDNAALYNQFDHNQPISSGTARATPTGER